MPETAESWAELLKLAARFVFYEGGWRGGLLRFAGLLSSLGIINGFIDWFLRLIGHPTGDSQPLWFTILCALLLVAIVVLGLDHLSRGKENWRISSKRMLLGVGFAHGGNSQTRSK